jgi:hypothetical protein
MPVGKYVRVGAFNVVHVTVFELKSTLITASELLDLGK